MFRVAGDDRARRCGCHTSRRNYLPAANRVHPRPRFALDGPGQMSTLRAATTCRARSVHIPASGCGSHTRRTPRRDFHLAVAATTGLAGGFVHTSRRNYLSHQSVYTPALDLRSTAKVKCPHFAPQLPAGAKRVHIGHLNRMPPGCGGCPRTRRCASRVGVESRAVRPTVRGPWDAYLHVINLVVRVLDVWAGAVVTRALARPLPLCESSREHMRRRLLALGGAVVLAGSGLLQRIAPGVSSDDPASANDQRGSYRRRAQSRRHPPGHHRGLRERSLRGSQSHQRQRGSTLGR